MNETFRNELIHFLAAFFLVVTFTPQLGFGVSLMICFAFGFFLDVDHLFDYFLYLKNYKQKFSIKNFLSGQHFATTHRMYVLFHSWELVIFLWLPYLYFGEVAFWAASLALLSHLIIDQFTNNVSQHFYFLTYRFFNNFRRDCI